MLWGVVLLGIWVLICLRLQSRGDFVFELVGRVDLTRIIVLHGFGCRRRGDFGVNVVGDVDIARICVLKSLGI